MHIPLGVKILWFILSLTGVWGISRFERDEADRKRV